MTYPLNPWLECDVVMKGGITSGVIYPRAVCELAKTYRLKSIGGASAGAIAATGAAAAELGRASGGFDLLAALPQDLTKISPAGESVLYRLFQPTTQSMPLYRVFVAGMGKNAKILHTVAALLRSFWPRALACAALGIMLMVIAAYGSGPAVVAGVAGGLALAVVGAAVGVLTGAVKNLASIARAGFGLCTGMPGAGAKDAPALTPFLHERFQAMAGRPDGDVLTFGDLAAGGVELRVMTTNLTRRQPMPMPWNTQEYFFDPDEMRTLFPPAVVDYMVAHPPAANPDENPLSDRDIRIQHLLRAQAGWLRPWPAFDHLPVIVATRMSLSFPVLIAAVPLYAVDYSLTANREASEAAREWLAGHPGIPPEQGAAEIEAKPTFARNWFSDGGICANLPVHFFDSPLPSRPTFAIDLENFPPDRPKDVNPSRNCYLPIANNAGLEQTWATLPTANTTVEGIRALGTFIGQIIDTARSWVDATQLVMPGYRDRVVTIYHDASEGGMNLKMSAPTVSGLADRGEAAAALLVDKFTGAPTDEYGRRKPRGWGWNNQRWIRFRTATAGLDIWLTTFNASYAREAARPTLRYDQLAGPSAAGGFPSYPIPNDDDRGEVNDLTMKLTALAAEWSGSNPLRTVRVPHPRPRLRLVPDDGVAGGTTQYVDAFLAADPSAET